MPKILKKKKLQERISSGEYIPPVLLLEDALQSGTPIVVGVGTDITDCKKRKQIIHTPNLIKSLLGTENIKIIDLDRFIMVIQTDNKTINQNAMMLASKLTGYRWTIKGIVYFIPKNLFKND